jgi:hypothetical protein
VVNRFKNVELCNSRKVQLRAIGYNTYNITAGYQTARKCLTQVPHTNTYSLNTLGLLHTSAPLHTLVIIYALHVVLTFNTRSYVH